MSTISATDAKNRFGELLELSRKAPVHVQKNGRDVAVVISPEEFARLQANSTKPARCVRSLQAYERVWSAAGKVYEALAK